MPNTLVAHGIGMHQLDHLLHATRHTSEYTHTASTGTPLLVHRHSEYTHTAPRVQTQRAPTHRAPTHRAPARTPLLHAHRIAMTCALLKYPSQALCSHTHHRSSVTGTLLSYPSQVLYSLEHLLHAQRMCAYRAHRPHTLVP